MIEWKRDCEGMYSFNMLPQFNVQGFVLLEGELWQSFVAYNGKRVDQGEWDGREIAMRNAKRGAIHAIMLRNPGKKERDVFGQEEDEDE